MRIYKNYAKNHAVAWCMGVKERLFYNSAAKKTRNLRFGSRKKPEHIGKRTPPRGAGARAMARISRGGAVITDATSDCVYFRRSEMLTSSKGSDLKAG